MGTPYRIRKNATIKLVDEHTPRMTPAALSWRSGKRDEFRTQLAAHCRSIFVSAQQIRIDDNPVRIEGNGTATADGTVLVDGRVAAHYFLYEPAPRPDRQEGLL